MLEGSLQLLQGCGKGSIQESGWLCVPVSWVSLRTDDLCTLRLSRSEAGQCPPKVSQCTEFREEEKEGKHSWLKVGGPLKILCVHLIGEIIKIQRGCVSMEIMQLFGDKTPDSKFNEYVCVCVCCFPPNHPHWPKVNKTKMQQLTELEKTICIERK